MIYYTIVYSTQSLWYKVYPYVLFIIIFFIKFTLESIPQSYISLRCLASSLVPTMYGLLNSFQLKHIILRILRFINDGGRSLGS